MKRFTVRRSRIHGRGVFALRPIKAGELLLEYKGQVIAWRTATQAHRCNGQAGHTFYFGLSNGRVIDGSSGGNSARWLNHACEPNCQAIESNNRIFIEVTRDVFPDEELFIDYGLEISGDVTELERRAYACRCRSVRCRGTMIARV
ncbi:SET domain-containing protein [Burkholderia oklahomensis]|uniref:SET domain protein n=1 Tax=Burkholderia oklahomensis TaxID=342113 RepID=A0AAI8FPA4_9BURK|nr:SET domain-containing protein-lysine N-methyltransferase [Burkholderia oklahomensis]AIO67730.1 SET domain protein [Burkholderia oklahomensis]AOI41103.1 SET domain-containing protein-lysine N-methyltransferase [Burkholderia oklahomensis EO147]KUY50860.1 SET domain-containing protein-lysine N-methyltransferase [Burkholderia oklahomensis EO147]QPS35819.1 SET domain-containing protein-lysine N-methyltransferase [Burkholderia oklahomensis]